MQDLVTGRERVGPMTERVREHETLKRERKKKRLKKQRTQDAVGTLCITFWLFSLLFFCRGIAKWLIVVVGADVT